MARRTAEENARLGNPAKRARLAAPPVVVPPMEIMPPATMSDDAKRVWIKLAPDLINLKILRATDASTFSIFCESFALYAKTLVQLLHEGTIQNVATVSGDKMRRINPRYIVFERERKIVLQYAEKFGLTPLDRIRVIQHLAGGALPPADPRAPSPQAASDDVEQDLLDISAALSDAGPVGALKLAN